jgi:hypothetical protein
MEGIRFRPMVLDVLKWTVVLVVIHLLWFFVAPQRNTLLAPQFIGMLLFLISGLVCYWLIVDPYRNMIYPPNAKSETEMVSDCETPPPSSPPHGVPDDF